MSHCSAGVTFDTDFHVPPDCLQDGKVHCRVIASDCEILDVCDGWVTFRVELLLKLTIRSGCHSCSFEREVVLEESVYLGACAVDCEVTAALCRCVLRNGKVRCSGGVAIRFHVQRPVLICQSCQTVCILPVIVVPVRIC